MNNNETDNDSQTVQNNLIQKNIEDLNLSINKKNIILPYNEINSNKENEDCNILEINKPNNIKYNNITENNNVIKPNFLNDIKYGIDEDGNPMNINDYYKNINNKNGNKKRRPIAYIIKDQNNNNILVDLNGNKIIQKNKDGDYEFPFHFKILIKDFDVKHPELRVNGERLYPIEESPNSKNDNLTEEKKEKNILNNDKEKIVDEISLQIESTETNESTSQKVNNNINCLFKKNIWNKKKFMDLWKLRYGNYNNILRSNTIINTEKEERIPKIKNINRRFKNYSYNKTNNQMNTPNNQEIISRTNSILNSNSVVDDIYYKKSSENSNVNSTDKTNTNKYNNYYNKNIIKINRDYFSKKNIPFSPIKNINLINSYTNKNNNKFHHNRVIHNYIFSNLNSEQNIFKNNNNSQKNDKNYINDYYFNDSETKKNNNLSTLITTPYIGINKNKTKKIFKDFNYNSNKCIFYSNQNSINNNRINRIRNNFINKTLSIKLDNTQNNNYINEENKNKNNCLIINKCLSKDNIMKKKENNIYKKAIKKRNYMTPSDIRSIEISENSIMEYNRNENKENKIENKNKNKIKNSKICKLIKRIPINPKKKVQNKNNKCSILTNEANNMIKKYILNKNIIINKKNILKISLLKDSNEKGRIFNKRNQSFNGEKKNKGLYTDFNY